MPNNRQDIDKAIAKYQAAIDKNTSESEVLWSRYNTMLVFNSILITAIGISYQDNIHLPRSIITLLPIVGLITCCIWFFTTYKGFRWIYNWIVFARDIESKYLKDNKLDFNPILRGSKESKPFIKINSSIEIGKTEFASYILIGLTIIMYLLFMYNIFNGNLNFRQQRKAFTRYNNYHSQVVRSKFFKSGQ